MNNASIHSATRRPRGPVRALSDFFNSIWLGITLIALILIYGTLGSAIPGFRQMFELTEFRYFNHWILGTLLVLFCINLTVATFRRIKFNRINAGVLTVHTGLLVLCYGSFVYFGNKIEGDLWLGTPTIKIFSVDRFKSDPENAFLGSIPAIEGEVWDRSMPMLGGRHRIEVTSVKHDGMTTASRVTLKATLENQPAQEIELSLGNPREFSHMAKLGERLAIALNGSPEASYFYDDTTPALIVPLGEDRRNWAHFELPELPYYHERFVEYGDGHPLAKDVVAIEDMDGKAVKSRRTSPIPLIESWRMPIDVIAKGSAMAEDWPITMTVDGFLPYAELQPQPLPGGDRTFPLVLVDYRHGEDSHKEWLISEAPERAAAEFHDGARVEFRWIGEATTIDPAWSRQINGTHVLDVFVKDKGVRKSYDVKAGNVINVEGTDYVLQIEELRPSWPLMTAGFQNARTPIALVVVKSPTTTFQRSVMQRFPQLNQDRFPQSHPDASKRGTKMDPNRDLVDDNIELSYIDASTDHFLIVAGENHAPTLIHTASGGKRAVARLETNEPFKGADGSVTLVQYFKTPRFESVPVVVPERNRRSLMDVRREKSAIRVLLESKDGKWAKHVWVPFSMYNTDNLLDQIPPTQVRDVPGVGEIQLIYGRAMRPLPTTMTLERLKTEMYPGEAQAREWTSHFRYRDPQTGHATRGQAFLNNTYTIGDWTFFQARASGDHKSWTVLGVGNRRGVWTMFWGSVMVSLGMAYAFAVKPVLVRRRKERLARSAEGGM